MRAAPWRSGCFGNTACPGTTILQASLISDRALAGKDRWLRRSYRPVARPRRARRVLRTFLSALRDLWELCRPQSPAPPGSEYSAGAPSPAPDRRPPCASDGNKPWPATRGPRRNPGILSATLPECAVLSPDRRLPGRGCPVDNARRGRLAGFQARGSDVGALHSTPFPVSEA